MVKYKTALTRVISQYTDAGLSIRCIFSDQIFQPVLQHFKEANPSIDFNLTNSIEHVPKQMKCSLDTIQKAKCQSEGEKKLKEKKKVTEAREADDFIEDYVLNDQAYLLNNQSSA